MISNELIDEFEKAAEGWARRTGETETSSIVFWGMIYTGAMYRYSTVGAVDTSAMSKAQREKLSFGQLRGHHTLDQLIEHIKHLVHSERIDEELLVTGLVRLIDDQFDDSAGGYARDKAKQRERAQEIRDYANDAEFVEDWDRKHSQGGREPTGVAGLLDLAAFVARLAQASPSELRDRVQARDVWRELTNRLLDYGFRHDWRSRWLSEQAQPDQ